MHHRTPRFALALSMVAVLVACGGGGDSRVAPSAVDTRKLAQAASEELSVVLPDVADPLFQGLNIPADAPTRGMWSATQAWPMNGLHAVLLPDGKVLTYGTPQNTPGT